jgi:hypothetical protein
MWGYSKFPQMAKLMLSRKFDNQNKIDNSPHWSFGLFTPHENIPAANSLSPRQT